MSLRIIIQGLHGVFAVVRPRVVPISVLPEQDVD